MVSRWPIQKIWPRETVVVVATGPSFTAKQARTVGLARASGLCRVITVNDAVYPCWFADIAYAADTRWWKHHKGLPGFSGQRLSIVNSPLSFDAPSEFPDVHAVLSSGTDGFDESGDAIRTAGNSGYQAVHLAVLLGPIRVILVGFDMRDDDGQKHWFGPHPKAIALDRNPAKWRQRFTPLAEAARRLGVDVVNASPNSALDCFQMVDLRLILGVME